MAASPEYVLIAVLRFCRQLMAPQDLKELGIKEEQQQAAQR
jgi:hypothetical protein